MQDGMGGGDHRPWYPMDPGAQLTDATKRLTIPTSKAKWLIGRRGTHIVQVERATSTRVDLTKVNESETLVTIVAATMDARDRPRALAECERLIRDKLRFCFDEDPRIIAAAAGGGSLGEPVGYDMPGHGPPPGFGSGFGGPPPVDAGYRGGAPPPPYRGLGGPPPPFRGLGPPGAYCGPAPDMGRNGPVVGRSDAHRLMNGGGPPLQAGGAMGAAPASASCSDWQLPAADSAASAGTPPAVTRPTESADESRVRALEERLQRMQSLLEEKMNLLEAKATGTEVPAQPPAQPPAAQPPSEAFVHAPSASPPPVMAPTAASAASAVPSSHAPPSASEPLAAAVSHTAAAAAVAACAAAHGTDLPSAGLGTSRPCDACQVPGIPGASDPSDPSRRYCARCWVGWHAEPLMHEDDPAALEPTLLLSQLGGKLYSAIPFARDAIKQEGGLSACLAKSKGQSGATFRVHMS